MLNTTVRLTTDQPTGIQPVTFGLPLVSAITNTPKIKISLGGSELEAHIAPGLLWQGTNFLRSVIINVIVDMSQGDVVLSITDEGSVLRSDHMPAEWVSAGPDKADLAYPRVLAIHDVDYLEECEIIPPFSKPSQEFIDYLDGQFLWSEPLDYPSSTKGNWLFDRPSAYFKAYMVTGDPRYLKEAILSKQYYFNHIETAGVPKDSGGRGGCYLGGASRADGKYIYTQPAKLCLALVGDSSQWDDSLINDMAIQADIGWNQYPTGDEHGSENEGFTERGAGLAGLCELNAYEITGNQALLANLNTRISSLKGMQQDSQAWKLDGNWPLSGAFDHNFLVHEGVHNESSAPVNSTNDHGFSTWMSENIADFLWQTYWVTGNTDAPEMLRRLGNAVNEHGYTSSYNPATGEFDSKGFVNSHGETKHTHGANTRREDTDMLYFTSAQADRDTLVSDKWWKWYTDVHGVETILTLGVAYYFETDPDLRAGLKARIEAILDGSLNSTLAAVDSTLRLFNWQHRSNSVATWQWINGATTPPVEPEVPIEPEVPTDPKITVSVTGQGSAYWVVTVEGVEQTPRHSSNMEAVEHAVNEAIANPAKEVLILHDAIYKVIVSE